MNIELKPIAESKVRQLGGDVCGVLVRTDDGVMAVSEHGRCTRLDAGVMGPVESACMSDMRDEFEAAMAEIFDINDEAMARVKAMRHVDEEGTECYQGWEDDEAPRTFSTAWLVWKRARAQGGEHWAKSNPGRADQYRAEALAARDVLGLGSEDSEDVSPSDIRNAVNAMRLPVYTHPQPAQQSNQDDVIALLTNALANIRDTDASAKTLQSMAALALRAAKETCDE
ncbi:hypothetical protein OZ656_06260 [Marinobacter sp. LM1]|uniref:hypothetical protein n=1 Tax=Marinobacter sp. LM1 TaxID=3003349 RepID=UPI0036D3E847